MREFDGHQGILFDEASCAMVLRQKKLCQAQGVRAKLGCSTTNCHAYDVFISGVAVMISSNTWMEGHPELERDADKQWLIDNSILLQVGASPMWVSRGSH